LVALPEIKTVNDLKGRKIVCHSKAPCVSGNLRAVLQECGLKPEEINMDVIDDTSGRFLDFVDEITSGKAVAALVDMPFDLYGIKKGLHVVELPDRPVIHNTTLLATSDYIRENKETVYAFIKGFIEALHYFKNQTGGSRGDPKKQFSAALRPARRRVLHSPPARMGQAAVEKTISAAGGNPKRL
jgi:ABC-type nitrate/sulfonate/bicarbonate transport system substrate-binding protein